MPLYEFICKNCQREFELLVARTDANDAACPHCGAKKLAKKFSTFASQVKNARGSAPVCTTNPRSCPRCGPHHRH